MPDDVTRVPRARVPSRFSERRAFCRLVQVETRSRVALPLRGFPDVIN